MQYIEAYISINYKLTYRFTKCNHIMFTSDLKRVFNYQSGNEIFATNNLKRGFWFNRKFYRLDKIKSFIEFIPKYEHNKNDPLINLK